MDISFTNAGIIYDSFEKKLTKVYKKELFYDLLESSILTSVAFLLLGFVIVLLEAALHFRSNFRTILFYSYTLSFFTSYTYLLLYFLLKFFGIIKPVNLINYSGKVGNYFSDIKDKLSNSLSLYKKILPDTRSEPFETGNEKFRRAYYSEELIIANLTNVNEIAGNKEFLSFISFTKLKKIISYLFITIFIIAVNFLFFPSALSSSMNRLVNYKYNFINNDYGIAFEVSPGNYETFKGDKVNISIKVKSNKPDLKIEEIEFIMKQYTGDGIEVLSDSKDLKMVSENSFATTIENINNNITYYAEYKGIRSDEYKIKISDYPIVKGFYVTIAPPEYTAMPTRKLNENEGDIFCAEGSKLTFEINSSKELLTAGIVLNDNYSALKVNGDDATGIIEANQEGIYKIKLKDKEGRESRNEKTYNIKLIKNSPPKIIVIEPADANYQIKGEKEILLRARISDDYGFSKLNLFFRKVNTSSSASPQFTSVNIPIKNLNATELDVPYIWNISGLNLRNGNAVEYYLEVTDNTGKTGKSDLRILTLKSLTEILKKSEELSKNIEKDLKSLFEDIKNLNEEIKELKKNNTEELGLNDPKKKQELQNKVENMQNNLDATQKKIEQGINEMMQKNNLSEKTLEQFMKLQELFNKINTPQFREMLKKLQEAMKKNDMNQLREEMKNFRFDEEAFKKQIEQVMELMKKIENLQKFGELTQKLDDIRKDQEELKKQTENTKNEETGKLNTLSNKQQDIKDKMKDFKDELQKLTDEMKKMKEDMSPADLEKLKDKLNQKKTENKMQKSSSELIKNQKENSLETQEEIMDDLNEMNEDMQNALENTMNMQGANQKMMDKMKQIKKEIEELSRKQQELKEKTNELQKNDKQEFQRNQKEQKDLQGDLTKDINDLMNLTKDGLEVTPELGKELGNAYNKMDKAGEELGESKKESAMNNQGKAKQCLDNASKMLGDMIGKMQQQQGKGQQKGNGRMGSLMQRLAQLISQQQGVNGEMQKMGENGKTGKDGKNGQEEMQGETKLKVERLKLEQEEIRKSLEQLNEEFEKEKQRSGEKLLGDLKEVEKQMKDVVKDLSNYNVDDKLIEKQNRILSRMLDAQLSQREKDFEQKRESRPGENVLRNSPPEIIISGPNSVNELKSDFLKLQKEGFTEDYEALIMRYLMEIKK